MALDLNCPSCASDNTQRLSVMRSQQSVGGTLGKGQTALAASFQEPSKPWASTIGFVIGLCTIPILSAFSGGATSPVPVLGFLLVWLGIRCWIKQTYDLQLQKWQDKLEQSFICLRCGEVFSPLFDSSKQRNALDLDRQEAREKLSNKRLGYAVMFGIALVGLAVYSVYESTPSQTPKPIEVSKPVVSSSTSPSRTSTDPLLSFIQQYGKPDIDDSTQNDNPRPPIVTRWLIYKAAGVRVWFVPDAPVSTPPPYRGWKLTVFQDENTQKPLNAKHAERRLQQSKQS